MAVRWVRRGAVLGLGALWWWAVARLVLVPDAGVVEGAVAAGGWGLSVLPVHCMPRARAEGALEAGRWRRAWRAGAVGRPATGRDPAVGRASQQPDREGPSDRS
ncbi:hypothetical protein ACFYOV_07770 [Streptomyces sp. NPDC005931]|uniref:hypothetical protein n=1 Tax=Streptomyces sp. NPDC005931 TaxID=3364737 RepID=UPI0036C85677